MLGVGIPGLLLVCIAVPLAIFLVRERLRMVHMMSPSLIPSKPPILVLGNTTLSKHTQGMRWFRDHGLLKDRSVMQRFG